MKTKASPQRDAEAHQTTHRDQRDPGRGLNVLTLRFQVRRRRRETPASTLEVKASEGRGCSQQVLAYFFTRRSSGRMAERSHCRGKLPCSTRRSCSDQTLLDSFQQQLVPLCFLTHMKGPIIIVLPNYFNKTRASADLQTSQNTGGVS